MTAKSCRDALFVHVQAGKHIILPGDKRLVSHLSASFGQCLLFQALYQSTRIENRHPSYKSQGERSRHEPFVVRFSNHEWRAICSCYNSLVLKKILRRFVQVSKTQEGRIRKKSLAKGSQCCG